MKAGVRDGFINVLCLLQHTSDAFLDQIAEDACLIRQELAVLKEEVNDLRDLELEVRPEYLEKLRKIDAGEFKRLSSIDELRQETEKE